MFHRLLRRGASALVGLLAVAAIVALSPLGTRPVTAAPTGDPHQFATPIFTADARGDVVTIGNVTTACDPTYANDRWSAEESRAACIGATSGATGLTDFAGKAMPPVNNRLAMRFVDVDDDPSTFASSIARLRIPTGARILWAGLHWNAATVVPDSEAAHGSTFHQAPPELGRRFDVTLTAPGQAPAAITAGDRWDDTNPGGTTSYGGYAEVTDLVRAAGAGDYTVANVQSCTGFGGCFGSWSLTVAFAHPDEPARNLAVWHGWKLTSPSIDGGIQQFTVAGLTPPPHGPVHTRIGVVQADGDRGQGPDSLELSSTSHPAWAPFDTVDRPLSAGESDWFNSTTNAYGVRRPNTDATPNLLANLNQDIALVDDDTVVGNDDDAMSFRVRTAGSESLYSQVVHAAIDLHQPTIALTKEVAPTGPVAPGTEVTWTLHVANDGIDPIRSAVVTDPLPDGLRYVPDSVTFAAGGPASLLGTKTDRAGDDQADWDPEHRTLTFRVGAGADATTGGTLAVPPADDGSDHLTITFRTVVETEPATITTNDATARGVGRDLIDGFGPLVTEATASAPIATLGTADLRIAKSDGDATIAAVGDRYRYELTVTNDGPAPATGVRVTDELDRRLRFVGSPDGCTAADQAITCPIGDLAVGATERRRIDVKVVELPGPGRSIPNVATVTGDLPDPDCDADHPDAGCNTDDETTPQRPAPVTTTTVATRDRAATPSTTKPSTPVRTTGPATVNRGSLPRTGGDARGPVLAGASLAILGTVVLGVRRRAARR